MSSDEQLRRAQLQAIEEGSSEAWLRYEMLAERQGELPLEIFETITNVLQTELGEAERRASEAAAEAAAEARVEYQAEYGPNLVCATCKDSGWVRHWDTDYPCQCKDRTLFVPRNQEAYNTLLVLAKDRKGVNDLIVEVHRLHKLHHDRAKCFDIGIGAMVLYSNQRARAKFHQSDDKVPYYTLGTIVREYGPSEWDTSPRYRIRCTKTNREFVTSERNLDGKVYNPWARYKRLDVASVEADAFEKSVASDKAILKERFGTDNLVGKTVKLLGVDFYVFWQGARDGKLMIGARIHKNMDPLWTEATNAQA